MAVPLRFLVLLVALVALVDVAAPPLIEDRLQLGFCSADCPVQHAASGAAVTPATPPGAGHRLAVVVSEVTGEPGIVTGAGDAPDAPRAPPSA